MKKQQLFPTLSGAYSKGMVSDEIFLDGMRVLFNKKVMLMPVELEKKPKHQQEEVEKKLNDTN